MSDEELSAIQTRCDNALEGPWMVSIDENHLIQIVAHVETTVTVSKKFYSDEIAQRPAEFVTDHYGYVKYDERWQCDLMSSTVNTLEFVAHARNDIPRLVAEVRRLKGKNSSV